MATIKIDQFHGIQPRLHPTLLADGMAVEAHNVRLKNGKLVPLRMPKIVKDKTILFENGLKEIEDAKTMHVWEKTDGDFEFLLFPGVTWMAEGNLADDNSTRVIVSGETGRTFVEKVYKYSVKDGEEKEEVVETEWHNAPVLYLRDPDTPSMRFTVDLCKNPLPKPKVSRTGELTDEKRYTHFFWTWVDKYGYESPVSVASDEIEYMDGDTISFEGIGSDKYPQNAVALRIYKVITGSEVGRIQFIKELSSETVANGALGCAVTVKDEDAGEVLMEFTSPPGDLQNIVKVAGNYYVGFSQSFPKTVMFSEIDMPYSYPMGYRYDVEDNIVTIATTSNTVFVLTDGYPFVLSGTDPSTMTVTKIAGPSSCVSPRSVCVFKNALYFASHLGLMTIFNDANSGTVCTNLTEKIFTKEQWLAKNPSSCVIAQYDGALHLFFTHTDGKKEGLMIDLNEQSDSITTHDEESSCVCVDNKTDRMYFIRDTVKGV